MKTVHGRLLMIALLTTLAIMLIASAGSAQVWFSFGSGGGWYNGGNSLSIGVGTGYYPYGYYPYSYYPYGYAPYYNYYGGYRSYYSPYRYYGHGYRGYDRDRDYDRDYGRGGYRGGYGGYGGHR